MELRREKKKAARILVRMTPRFTSPTCSKRLKVRWTSKQRMMALLIKYKSPASKFKWKRTRVRKMRSNTQKVFSANSPLQAIKFFLHSIQLKKSRWQVL